MLIIISMLLAHREVVRDLDFVHSLYLSEESHQTE